MLVDATFHINILCRWKITSEDEPIERC